MIGLLLGLHSTANAAMFGTRIPGVLIVPLTMFAFAVDLKFLSRFEVENSGHVWRVSAPYSRVGCSFLANPMELAMDSILQCSVT